MNLAGFAVTCVTVIAEPNQAVWFGVLNLIGCSMMIVSVLSDNLKKISPLSGALISLLLYAVSYDLQKGCVGFFGLDIVKLPDFLYSCKYLAFLGFPSSDFVSADYFPIIPWIFLFTAGFYLWNFIAQKNLAKYFEFKIPLFDKNRQIQPVDLSCPPACYYGCFDVDNVTLPIESYKQKK